MASFGEATVHEVAAEPAPEADGAASTVSDAGADAVGYVPATPLEAKMAETIKGITAGRESKPKFVKIQLQFPKVAAVFDKVRSTFVEIDTDGSGTIELSEMTGALAKVRIHGTGSLPLSHSPSLSRMSSLVTPGAAFGAVLGVDAAACSCPPSSGSQARPPTASGADRPAWLPCSALCADGRGRQRRRGESDLRCR